MSSVLLIKDLPTKNNILTICRQALNQGAPRTPLSDATVFNLLKNALFDSFDKKSQVRTFILPNRAEKGSSLQGNSKQISAFRFLKHRALIHWR